MLFDYNFSGKQVVLALDPGILPVLKLFGIASSPVVARVYKMDTAGIWLENPHFSICPVGTRRLYNPQGQSMCLAHIFIPARAILSLAVFPTEVKDLEEDPAFSRIGFSAPVIKKRAK